MYSQNLKGQYDYKKARLFVGSESECKKKLTETIDFLDSINS